MKSRAPQTDKYGKHLPDGWRRWVLENLVLDVPAEVLAKMLTEQGLDDDLIQQELQEAQSHPYAQVAKTFRAILNRRHWLLMTLGDLALLDPRCQEVERRSTPDFQTFLRDYYSANRPVILTDAIDHWPAKTQLTPDYLVNRFGHAEVEVQTNREGNPMYERECHQHKQKMRFAQYADRILNTTTNDMYLTANNNNANWEVFRSIFEEMVGNIGDGYFKPEDRDGRCYLWFGPKGSITPLHHDIANIFLAQIHGRKRIQLVPAWQVPLVYNDAYVFSRVDMRDPHPETFPLFEKAHVITVDLMPGETLFIPVGWWHCVEGLDASISLSFIHFNAPNDFSGWENLSLAF